MEKNNLGRRILMSLFGVIICAISMGIFKIAALGVDPFQSFMAGLDAEKQRLKGMYPVWSRTASLAIGYREGDDRAKILTRTCQLAKRQDTWFRHQATPIYVDPSVEAVRACWQSRGPWKVSFPT